MKLTQLQKVLWTLAGAGVIASGSLSLWVDYRGYSTRQVQEPAFGADFELTDHQGTVRTDDDFAGQWLLVFFGITFFLIGRGMVPKVMGTVALRDQQIADDLAAAQAARDAADRQEEAWRERENENRAKAQGLISEAKAKASAASEKKLAAAQERLDAQLAAAESDIEAARTSAMAEVEDVAAEATQDIVARLAGAKVDKRTARSAVKKALVNG